MIINHKYQFCYFAIPRTASKAISKVLVEEFGSEEVHRMHMSYGEFMEVAREEEKGYFKFASIRNPLDSVVSAYFKKKEDHRGRFSRGSFKKGRKLAPRALEEYAFITEQDADFATYFQRFYQEPYSRPRHEETVRHMDAVIRFENLQMDFDRVLQQLNLPSTKIPEFNRTAAREREFLAYYKPEVQEQAKRVFSTIMSDWDYAFPESWR